MENNVFEIEKGIPRTEKGRAQYGLYKKTLEKMAVDDSVSVKSRKDILRFYRAARRMKRTIGYEIYWQNSEYPDEIRGRVWRAT